MGGSSACIITCVVAEVELGHLAEPVEALWPQLGELATPGQVQRSK